MNTRTLTSANAVILLSVTSLFPVPRKIEGFSADDITSTEALALKQTSMGLDGRLSAGFVPQPTVQSIVLQSDSESNDFFEQWAEAEKQVREAYVAVGTLLIPSTQRKYSMTRGFLTSFPPTPSLRNIVQPRTYAITWENVSPAPYL